jgi:hypothetical protein
MQELRGEEEEWRWKRKILKHRWCVVLVLVMMETIHSSGGYAVIWRDLDAGQSTARICMLILQTCIEIYNYMVRYNKILIYT